MKTFALAAGLAAIGPAGPAHAQDSLVVRQHGAAMFSNSYVFYANKTFRHFYRTDDAQLWYGSGTYRDFLGLRFLRFGPADGSFGSGARVHYEADFTRRLTRIRCGFRSRDHYHTSRKRSVEFLAADTALCR